MALAYCPVYRFVNIFMEWSLFMVTYRGVNKSLARPGMKQANVSVRMA